jgi:hypothetical protein
VSHITGGEKLNTPMRGWEGVWQTVKEKNMPYSTLWLNSFGLGSSPIFICLPSI